MTSTLVCKILLPPGDDCNLFAKNGTICGGSIQIHLREDSLQCYWRWSVGRCRSIIDAITISFTAQLAHLLSAQVHICIPPSYVWAPLHPRGKLLCFNSIVCLVSLFQFFCTSGASPPLEELLFFNSFVGLVPLPRGRTLIWFFFTSGSSPWGRNLDSLIFLRLFFTPGKEVCFKPGKKV